MVIKTLYCVFLGALVALFVGWAMCAWYPTPQWETEYPGVSQYMGEPYPPSAESLKGLNSAERTEEIRKYKAERKEHESWEKKHAVLQRQFDNKLEIQGRNVALISLLVAVAVTGISVGLSGKLPVVSEGLLLGGVFTLIYSIGWSFVRAPKVAVIPVGIGLILTIAIGYKRFARPAR
ncbi:MAG: hypothetical protein A2Z18_04255 [Armatimonadetes bacterium RBG_16_58_9]|nr:MAG: hypothetical protein A2Z18_04255 [Armatimonadetes bacterium RBG_16_58_9]